MTHLQWGTLKYIANHDVTTDHIRLYSLVTLGSLLVRGWIERKGNMIGLTKAGMIAYEQYQHPEVNYRKAEGELSERVSLMLHLSNVRQMKKTG